MPNPVLRRDSAGVSIVESNRPQWPDGGEWRVGEEPLISIGELSGDPAYEFGEIIDARLLPSGGIIAADLMLAEVRFFSEDGEFLRTFGRRGEGPGEFQRIQKLGTEGDRTWVFDRGMQRVTWIPESNEVAEVLNLIPAQRALLQGRLPDGSWLVVPLFDLPAAGERLDGGVHRGLLPLLRYGATGQLQDTLLVTPGTEMVYVSDGGETRPWGLPLFGKRAAVAIGGAGVLVGDQDQFEVREYDLRGELIKVIRLPGIDLSISDEEYSAVLEARIRGAPEQFRPSVRSILSSLPRPTAHPAFADFLVDRAGNLWIASVPTLDQPARGRNLWGSNWNVISRDGAWLGVVSMPRGFQPSDIGDEWVLGIFIDAQDIPQVRMYELIKHAP